MRAAFALQDGSIAIIDADGLLDIQDHASGKWASKKENSIDSLFTKAKTDARNYERVVIPTATGTPSSIAWKGPVFLQKLRKLGRSFKGEHAGTIVRPWACS